MSSKKGFTLIELLAVIVILAILILVAIPAVTNIIESSARNTFKNEVLGIAKTMENAYTEKFGNGEFELEEKSDNKIHTLTIDGKSYSYLCMTLKDLYDEQYIKKNLGDNYGGYLQMYIGENQTKTFINVTNGSYYIQGYLSAISEDSYEPSKTIDNNFAVANNVKCPGTVSTSSSEP